MAKNDALAVQRTEMVTFVESQLERNRDLIKPVLPAGVDFDAVKGRMKFQLMRDEKLWECGPNSVFWCIVKSMALGLEIGDIYGEGYIVGYNKNRDNPSGKKVAQFIPGYKGLEKLTRQSPLVQTFSASLVYENDVFDLDLGTANVCVFRPNVKTRASRGEVVCGYFRLELKNGSIVHTPVPWEYLERIRLRSRGKSDPANPWNTDREEMYRKTVMRYGLKDAPRSLELAQALALSAVEADENVELDEGEQVIEEQPPKAMRAEQSKRRLQERVATASAPGADQDEYPAEPPQRQPEPARPLVAPAPTAPVQAPAPTAPVQAPAPTAPVQAPAPAVIVPAAPQYVPPTPAPQAAVVAAPRARPAPQAVAIPVMAAAPVAPPIQQPVPAAPVYQPAAQSSMFIDDLPDSEEGI